MSTPAEPYALLRLLADIRAAVGDPTGKLMQDELRAHCANLLDRVTRAEHILAILVNDHWIRALNELNPGENLGYQVFSYWTTTDTTP